MTKLKGLPKPFVKWAGGKDQLMTQISLNLPIAFSRYFEPFVGGGAVFFYFCRLGFRGPVFLSDLNEELIVAYETIRDSVDELIAELKSGEYKTDEASFYQIRDWDRKSDWSGVDPVRRTARMIYLNRTCYNGLYRVNNKGHFNVPYGRYRNPRICDSRNLRAVSQALQDVKLECVDFVGGVKEVSSGDFVYFDPPYDPLSVTSSFTAYTKSGFGFEEQKRLAQVFHELTKRGCLVLESNSDTPMIRELYSSPSCIVQVVKAKRVISCDPKGRGAINELLIRNYIETRQRHLV